MMKVEFEAVCSKCDTKNIIVADGEMYCTSCNEYVFVRLIPQLSKQQAEERNVFVEELILGTYKRLMLSPDKPDINGVTDDTYNVLRAMFQHKKDFRMRYDASRDEWELTLEQSPRADDR